MKLDLKALGLALGITWGAAMFLFGVWATLSAPAAAAVNFLGDFYLGFSPGFPGAIIGSLWGFVDAAIGGVVIAWLYNLIAAKLAKT